MESKQYGNLPSHQENIFENNKDHFSLTLNLISKSFCSNNWLTRYAQTSYSPMGLGLPMSWCPRKRGLFSNN